jgi:hypothetical protein
MVGNRPFALTVAYRTERVTQLDCVDFRKANGMDPSPLCGIECQIGVCGDSSQRWGEVENEAYSRWGGSCEERLSGARWT